MRQSIGKKSAIEIEKIQSQMKEETEKAAIFDESKYDTEISKFRQLAKSSREKAENLKDYELRTETSTTTRYGYYGWRWWWYNDYGRRTTSSSTTRKIETKARSNMLAQAKEYEKQANDWETRKATDKTNFETGLAAKTKLITEKFSNLTSGNKEASKAIENHINDEITRIDVEISDTEKEKVKLEGEKAAVDQTYGDLKASIRASYKTLKKERASVDEFANECDKLIQELAEKRKQMQSSKTKWKLSEAGIIKLFTVAPKLVSEAETVVQNATIIEGNLEVFQDVIGKKDQKALTFEHACTSLEDYSMLSKYAPYLEKYQSLEMVSDFACEDEDDFNEFVQPALKFVLDVMDKEKRAAMVQDGDEKEKKQDQDEDPQFKAARKIAEERKRKKALNTVSKKFKKFCIDQPFKDIARKELLYYKQEFDIMISGLDVFCEYIYAKTNYVDSYLEHAHAASENKSIQLPKEQKNQQAIEASKRQKAITH